MNRPGNEPAPIRQARKVARARRRANEATIQYWAERLVVEAERVAKEAAR